MTFTEPEMDRIQHAYDQCRYAREALAQNQPDAADAHVATARALLSVVVRQPDTGGVR